MVVCTGCSLLCDDIEVIIENNNIKEIRNACLRGTSRIKGCKNRLSSSIDGKSADMESSIKAAVRILKSARSPMFFGLDNSTCEAQTKGIRLAKKLNAYIDDTSSFCQGLLIERILSKKLRTCSLEDIRNKADVLIYWGSDAQDSHPRHLSKFSYFPRGELRQRGYEEDRTAIAIDVRESNTAKICKNNFYRIPLKGDRDFILALIDALSGKVPEKDAKRILEQAAILKKAEFGAIFAGIGLTYSIKEDFDILIALMEKLPNFSIIPMIGHYNMRGFNETLFREAGYINRVKFEGNILHDDKYSIIEAVKNKTIDTLVIAGSDPVMSLPRSILSYIFSIPIICIDPCLTLTSKTAAVTIPCAASGVESGGTAVRMDGKVVSFSGIIKSEKMSDESIFDRLMEAV